jgi:hypothetical protein
MTMALKAAKNSMEGALYQGTTSVVPQTAKKDTGH